MYSFVGSVFLYASRYLKIPSRKATENTTTVTVLVSICSLDSMCGSVALFLLCGVVVVRQLRASVEKPLDAVEHNAYWNLPCTVESVAGAIVWRGIGTSCVWLGSVFRGHAGDARKGVERCTSNLGGVEMDAHPIKTYSLQNEPSCL